MNDIQVLTIAVSLVIPFSLLLLSNSRITDAKETLRAEMQTLRAEMATMRAELAARFNLLEAKMEKHHDTVMRLLADIGQRVTRLEERR